MTITYDGATEQVRQIIHHHALLRRGLEERAGTLCAAVENGVPHQQPLASLREYLASEIMRHAEAEERTLYQRGAGPIPGQELAAPQVRAQRRCPRPVLHRRTRPVRSVRFSPLPAARAFHLDHLMLGDHRLDRRDLGHLPPLHPGLPGALQPGAASAAGRRPDMPVPAPVSVLRCRKIRFNQRAGARQTLLVEPDRSYVICCVQRTGSWLLAHALAGAGYAGRPSDHFDDAEQENNTREWGLPAGDLTAYVRAMRDKATTLNGVLGSKLMWNDFDSLRSSLRPPAGTDPGLEFMRTTFPDPQFIWLRRQDKVRQGISWWRAAVTDQWALRPGQQAEQPAPDVEKIVQLVQFAQRCEDGWRQWFASTRIQPCQVLYEDLAQDRLAVANQVLEFLRLPQLDARDLPPVRYRKQADALTETRVDLVRSAMSSLADPVRPTVVSTD
jgi:trehalose 2-sulfotransferase